MQLGPTRLLPCAFVLGLGILRRRRDSPLCQLAAGDCGVDGVGAFFFAGREKAYVYLPGRRLEYRVVGAYLFNSRAIEGVDQSDPADLGDYFAELSSPDPSSFVGYKRRVALDPERDRVLQLSTCTVPADPALRFVVTCVYAGEEEL